MAEYRYCTVADEGRLRIVTINRPEVMNALHSEAHWELDGVWNEFAARDDLWVGIVTGAGERAFSAGNDLKVQTSMLVKSLMGVPLIVRVTFPPRERTV